MMKLLLPRSQMCNSPFLFFRFSLTVNNFLRSGWKATADFLIVVQDFADGLGGGNLPHPGCLVGRPGCQPFAVTAEASRVNGLLGFKHIALHSATGGGPGGALLSVPAVTIHWLSGLNSAVLIVPSCCSGSAICLPVFVSQRRAMLFLVTVKSRSPPGLSRSKRRFIVEQPHLGQRRALADGRAQGDAVQILGRIALVVLDASANQMAAPYEVAAQQQLLAVADVLLHEQAAALIQRLETILQGLPLCGPRGAASFPSIN